MGAALVGNNFSPKFHANSIKIFISHEKEIVTRRGPKFTKHQNLVGSQTESVSQEWEHVFFKRSGRGPQSLQPTRKRPVFMFMLARPTRASRAGEQAQELGR